VTGQVGKRTLLDSGFWFGLLDPRDDHHTNAGRVFRRIEKSHALVPWPTLYEVVRTRLVKNPGTLAKLEAQLRSPGVHLLEDQRYRQGALADCLAERTGRRAISLVDRILRAVISDVNVRIDAVVTFNPADFADVCRARRIELICE
jgi:predicted nucleic acid-binding protein